MAFRFISDSPGTENAEGLRDYQSARFTEHLLLAFLGGQGERIRGAMRVRAGGLLAGVFWEFFF